jgi:hypothetical protein
VGGFNGNDGEGYVNELLAAARCVLAWVLVRHARRTGQVQAGKWAFSRVVSTGQMITVARQAECDDSVGRRRVGRESQWRSTAAAEAQERRDGC